MRVSGCIEAEMEINKAMDSTWGKISLIHRSVMTHWPQLARTNMTPRSTLHELALTMVARKILNPLP
jgi:hypothetical protein